MQTKYNAKNLIQYIASFLFPLLLLNIFSLTSFSRDIRKIGEITGKITLSIGLIIFIISIISNNKKIFKIFNQYKLLYIGLFFFISAYLISHIINNNFDEDTTLLSFLLTIILIIAFVKIEWTPNLLVNMGYLGALVAFVFFLHWVTLDFPTNRFQSFFRNPNALGIVILCLLYFQILALKYIAGIKKLFFVFFIVFSVVLLYFTTSRSALLALIIAILSWFILKISPKLFSNLFFIILPSTFLFVFFYIKLQGTNIGAKLNEISLDVFHKNFFSGRGELWSKILNAGQDTLWFGNGIGIKPKEIAEVTLTSHNQYLQIFLETGVIGLIIFCLVLFSVWKLLIQNLDSYTAKWSACFFLGIIVYQTLELSLFHNNEALGYLQWLIIVIGISVQNLDLKKCKFIDKNHVEV